MVENVDKEEGDSGIDANSQGSCSSNDVKSKEKRKEKKKKKLNASSNLKLDGTSRDARNSSASKNQNPESKDIISPSEKRNVEKPDSKNGRLNHPQPRKGLVFESSRHPAEREDFESTGNENYVSTSKGKKQQ